MEKLLTLFKATSDETRLRLLVALSHRDLCVCEMTELLGESQPKISKHLSKLRDLHLVLTKRQDKYMVYTLNKDHQALVDVIILVQQHILKDSPLWQDQQHLTTPELWACIGVERSKTSMNEVLK